LPVASSITLCLLAPQTPATAQITPDATLGAESSIITPNININGIPTDQINGGAIRGTNLFHSFGEFNVGAGRGVYFTNPAGIANILTRITGINPSNIQGTLGVLGNANLFLMNPNGIIFGPNAKLDVGGSFVGSTASALNFPNGSEFSALNPQAPPLLSINIPIGLQYRGNTGSILVQRSSLNVPNGKTLALVGGNLSLNGANLQAAGGRVELAGVAGTGTVGLSGDGNNLSFSFPADVVRADVSLTGQSRVSVAAGGGGSIALTARNVDISGVSVLRAGIETGLGSVGAIAGDITLNATGEINVTDQGSAIANNVRSKSVGTGGNIEITTGSLFLTNGAQIQIANFGRGNGGRININAKDSISIDGLGDAGFPSAVITGVQPEAVGDVGEINITTGSLFLTNGGTLSGSTFGNGNGGNITINVRDTTSFDGVGGKNFNSSASSFVGRGAVGKGGDITLTTGSLLLTNGGQLASNTFSNGNGGKVTINARDTASFDGVGNNGFPSGVINSVESGAVGNGGDIDITASSFAVANGALVLANTKGRGNSGNITINIRDSVSLGGVTSNGLPSALVTQVIPTAIGKGGDITITTGSLSLINGTNLSTDTSGEGNAGNITIIARDTVSFDGFSSDGFNSGAFSQVRGGAVGKGGDIRITTGSLSLTNGGRVFATTSGQGDAGNVKISTRSLVFLDGMGKEGSTGIFSQVEPGGRGNGGSIEITTGLLRITNGAAVTASNAAQEFLAGDVTISADSLRLDNKAFISADTQGGKGNINLNSVDLVLRRGSNITTNASGEDKVGGNITIDTGVLVALENSDIAADSTNFRGGNVNLAAQGIFGTAFRPTRTPDSDITATGADSSLSGSVTINRFGIDPTTGLVVLPENVVDPAALIAQNPCERGKGSAFAVTGRGGLPSNPSEPLSSEAVRVGLVEPAPIGEQGSRGIEEQGSQRTVANSKSRIANPVVPAMGWVFNNKGEVVLTAYNPTSTGSQRPWVNPAACKSP
jgi:filamentous hemagglutinin family protein